MQPAILQPQVWGHEGHHPRPSAGKLVLDQGDMGRWAGGRKGGRRAGLGWIRGP